MTHHARLLPRQQLFSYPQPGQKNTPFSPTQALVPIMETDGSLIYTALKDRLRNAMWSNIGKRSTYNEIVWSSSTADKDIAPHIMHT
jgi:hypothetical protein